MSKEKKSGGFLSFFLIVISLAAAIFFGIMYFAQKTTLEDSQKKLSEAKSGYGPMTSEIADLRLRLNAAEDENKKIKETAVAVEEDKKNNGIIKGTLTHEKDPLPLGLIACAETKAGDDIFCATPANDGSYALKVPAGEYYVFAMETCYPPMKNDIIIACPSNFAYYTEFVKCDPAEADNQCPHDKAPIVVAGGSEIADIDPSDWFKGKK